jgi:hypothetical protein
MRPTLALAIMLVAARTDAATIYVSDPPPDPENYVQLTIGFANQEGFSREYMVRETGLREVEDWQLLPYENRWDKELRTIDSWWVPLADAQCDFKGEWENLWIILDLAEFIAAGDESLTLLLDTDLYGGFAWNEVTWDSPHLGLVERTYEKVYSVPEPALLAVGIQSGWQACLIAFLVFGLVEFVKRAGRRR